MSWIETTCWGRIVMEPQFVPAEEGDETDLLVTLIGIPAHPDGIVPVRLVYFADDAREVCAGLEIGAPVSCYGYMGLGNNLLAGNCPAREDDWLFMNDRTFGLQIVAEELSLVGEAERLDPKLEAAYAEFIERFEADSARRCAAWGELQAEKKRSTLH